MLKSSGGKCQFRIPVSTICQEKKTLCKINVSVLIVTFTLNVSKILLLFLEVFLEVSPRHKFGEHSFWQRKFGWGVGGGRAKFNKNLDWFYSDV